MAIKQFIIKFFCIKVKKVFLKLKLYFLPTRSEDINYEKLIMTFQIRDNYDYTTFYSPVLNSIKPLLRELPKKTKIYWKTT